MIQPMNGLSEKNSSLSVLRQYKIIHEMKDVGKGYEVKIRYVANLMVKR